MAKRVFVSYCRRQGAWVWETLVPCLKAGGAEVLIDRERFEAGKEIVGQMDATQDAAQNSVLVLSPEYLASSACQHEMERAIRGDPTYTNGLVVPVLRVPCTVPDDLRRALFVNLTEDTDSAQWDLLLRACAAALGTAAPKWIEARGDVLRHLRNEQSVNLVVSGRVTWRPIVDAARERSGGRLAIVDLNDPATPPRSGLIAEILRAWGAAQPVPREPYDLPVLKTALQGRRTAYLGLVHFDRVSSREYGIDFFAALRYLSVDARQLVLLVQSTAPFQALLPKEHPLSDITMQVVELRESA